MQLIICVMLVLSNSFLAADDDAQKELKALQGKWKTIALEEAGNPTPKESVPNYTMHIGADGKSTGKLPEAEFHFTFTVDPKKNPKTIDIVHETGDKKDKKQYGIYKLEGDKWTVCSTPPGSAESDRPKDFTTKDTSNVIFVFERIKEDKKP